MNVEDFFPPRSVIEQALKEGSIVIVVLPEEHRGVTARTRRACTLLGGHDARRRLQQESQEMGNKHGAAHAAGDKELASPPDSRGRSWSFHGLKSRKGSRAGTSGPFRGRSASLSDAGNKGKKEVGVSREGGKPIPVPNGKKPSDASGLLPPISSSVPSSRPTWRLGDEGGGRGGGEEDLLATRARVAARVRQRKGEVAAGRSVVGEKSGSRGAESERSAGRPVAASASAGQLSTTTTTTTPGISSSPPGSSYPHHHPHHIVSPPTPTTILPPHPIPVPSPPVTGVEVGPGGDSRNCGPTTSSSSLLPPVPAVCIPTSLAEGPMTTDSGYSTVSGGVDSYLGRAGSTRHDPLHRDPEPRPTALPAQSFSSMSADELRQVSEALYGDRVLLDLVKRRGRASLNRDLSLSQTSMVLTLAAENMEMPSHGTDVPTRSRMDSTRSASLHSLEEGDVGLDMWGGVHYPHHHHHHHHVSHLEDFDSLEHQFRPRSNSSTLAELNSRARARIAMGAAGARMRQSLASPFRGESYGAPGSLFSPSPHPPSHHHHPSEEVTYAQKLLVNRALKTSSPSHDSLSGGGGGGGGGDGGGGERGGGGTDITQGKRLPPQTTSSSPLHHPSPSHYSSTSGSSSGSGGGGGSSPLNVYGGAGPWRQQLVGRPLPDIHEHAPLSSSLPPNSPPPPAPLPARLGMGGGGYHGYGLLLSESTRQSDVWVRGEGLEEEGEEEEDWEPFQRPRSSSFTGFSHRRGSPRTVHLPGPSPAATATAAAASAAGASASAHWTDYYSADAESFRQRSNSLVCVSVHPGGVTGGSDGRVVMARALGSRGLYPTPSPSPSARPLRPSDRAWSYSVTSLAGEQTLAYCDVRRDFNRRVRDRPACPPSHHRNAIHLACHHLVFRLSRGSTLPLTLPRLLCILDCNGPYCLK
ncbi:hypothetical protein ACOMHN_041067 [Nucella lapillus]